jgi:predicted HicB family RNase H-like nuclease
MDQLMSHKGGFGSVRYSDEDRVFHGRLEFVHDLVTYESERLEELRPAFEEAVDDYLELRGRAEERAGHPVLR